MTTKTWIVPPEHRKPTPHVHTEENAPGQVKPVAGVVVHYTADDYLPSLNQFLNPATQSSAHFLIDRDGTVTQLAALEDRTWHANSNNPHYVGFEGNHDTNSMTLGIELVNYGRLSKDGEGNWVMWRGLKVKPEDAQADSKNPVHAAWEKFSEAQLKALEGLLAEIAKHFPCIGINPLDRIVGHNQIDPTRKEDPGPLFPWARIRKSMSDAYHGVNLESITKESAPIQEPVSAPEPEPVTAPETVAENAPAPAPETTPEAEESFVEKILDKIKEELI